MRRLLRPDALYALPYDFRRGLYATVKRKKFRRLQAMRETVAGDGYSLKSFDQYRCIFVHIPKAAGISICKSLFGNLGAGHATLADYQILFSRREFDDYFRFTFVRNPWDRLFSAYHFLRQGGFNESDRQWAPKLAAYEDFGDFVRRGLQRREMRRKLHFRPQHWFLDVPCNPADGVDFIGLFENIERDFEIVRARLDPARDVELRHENRTSARAKLDYRDHYDDQTRAIVARFYRQDIERFGYSFDNSSLAAQIARRERG